MRTAASLFPMYALAALYSFAGYFRLKLGYWPSYGKPDAGALSGGEFVVDAILLVLLILAFASPIWLGVLVEAGRRRAEDPPRLAILVISWLVFMLVVAVDPGDILHWFMD